jgi:hypothetical protein
MKVQARGGTGIVVLSYTDYVNLLKKIIYAIKIMRACDSVMVKALCYKPEVAGSRPDEAN